MVSNCKIKFGNVLLWISILLILVSNDVESNPGPINLESKMSILEKMVCELQKEVKFLRKATEQQSALIDQASTKMKSRGKIEEELSKMNQEIILLRETSNVQIGSSKKMRTDISSVEYEVAAVKKLVSHQRNDLKQLGNLAVNDLGTIKVELNRNNELLNKQFKDNEVLQTNFNALSRGVKQFCDIQREGLGALKSEVGQLRSSATDQWNNVKNSFVDILTNLEDVNDRITTTDENYGQKIYDIEKKLTHVEENLGSQKQKTKLVVENLERFSKQFGVFREKSSQTASKLETELTELGDVNKSLVAITSETLPRLESVLSEHWACIEGLSVNVNTIDKSIEGLESNVNDRITESMKQVEMTLEMSDKETSSCLVDLRSEISSLESKTFEEQAKLAEHLQKDLDDSNQRADRILKNVTARMDEIDGMYDDIQDRVFEIDKNRKNNLVFYGVKGDEHDQDDCERMIKSLFRTKLQITREISMTKVVRLWNGPSFRGFKPILVAFQLFKDKEEVLRKSSHLKGSNIYITEDFSRKIRKHRDELLKFAREIRVRDPSAKVVLQYDRLFVENDVFLYNETEQRVERVLMKMPEGSNLKKEGGLPIEEFTTMQQQAQMLHQQQLASKPQMPTEMHRTNQMYLLDRRRQIQVIRASSVTPTRLNPTFPPPDDSRFDWIDSTPMAETPRRSKTSCSSVYAMTAENYVEEFEIFPIVNAKPLNGKTRLQILTDEYSRRQSGITVDKNCPIHANKAVTHLPDISAKQKS